MADVFAYNGDSFLPEYLPGLIGYGQRGADGNNGATGASVHEEGAAAPNEEQLVLGTVSVEPVMLKKWITVTDEVLALKGQEFLDYVYDEIEFRILQLADAQVVAAIKAAPAAATTTKQQTMLSLHHTLGKRKPKSSELPA